jgi:hypothetical protein
MKKRIFKNVKYLLVILIIISFQQCSSGDDSPIEIEKAKRTDKLITSSQVLFPANPQDEVILDLQIEGISLHEFEKINTDSIYIKAGNKVYPISMTISGIIEKEETMKIFVVVPRDVQKLTLYVGSFLPKTFEVDSEIYAELKEP